MDDEPTAAEMGTGARHAHVHVALTQTLADLDRLRARREWPAEVDSIWEVLDEIKEAVRLGELLRRQALLTWESLAPLDEIIGTVIDEWPQGARRLCRCWSLSSPSLLAPLRSSKSRRHSDLSLPHCYRPRRTGEVLSRFRHLWFLRPLASASGVGDDRRWTGFANSKRPAGCAVKSWI